VCVCVCVCVCVQNELHMPQWFCGKLNHVFSAERVGFIFNKSFCSLIFTDTSIYHDLIEVY